VRASESERFRDNRFRVAKQFLTNNMVEPTPTSSSTGAPVVLLQKLTKVFHDFWMRDQVRAVDRLDLQIDHGQVFGLIGPNGSGKSTTIKMILGLLHKTSGRIVVFGKPPSDVFVKRRIGFLPEESYLYPFLNSRETLDFYGKLFGFDRRIRRRRIGELLSMVGLDAVQFRPIGQFSKGMQRRIGIAQALINDPDFLILDEPTSGLDPIGIRQIKDLILDLGQRGKTILLSSHMLADVEDVCDRLAILYGGQKKSEGTSQELLTSHDRTVIEVEALEPAQANDVVQHIEEHEGKQVIKVSPASQTLESLFLDIVQKAQTDRAQVHGASSGGPTAAFLRGDDSQPVEGDELIDQLMSAPEPTDASPMDTEQLRIPHSRSRLRTPSVDEQDDNLIDSLLADEQESKPEPQQASSDPSTSPTPQPEADHSVIDSLMDDETSTDTDENDTQSNGRQR